MPEPRRSSEKNKRAAECRVHQPTPPMPAGDVAKTLEVKSSDSYEARVTRIAEWRARLLGAVRLEERLQLLAQLGLSDSEVARSIPEGNARSVRRWRSEGVARGRLAGRWGPVDDLCAIIGFLLSDGTYDEEGVLAWLRSRHPELAQRRPLDALGAGDFSSVFEAAEQTLGPVASDTPAPGPLSQENASVYHGNHE